MKTAVSDKIIQQFITRYLHNPETRYMMWLHPRLPPRPLPDPPPPPRPCCCRCPRPPADRPLVDPLGAELTEVLQLVEVPEVVAVQVTQLIRLETEPLRFNISVAAFNSAFTHLKSESKLSTTLNFSFLLSSWLTDSNVRAGFCWNLGLKIETLVERLYIVN